MAERDMPTTDAEKYWYRLGAEHEARDYSDLMSHEAGPILSTVRGLTKQGRSKDYVIKYLVLVFTSTWTLWQRLQLAFKLVTGGL